MLFWGNFHATMTPKFPETNEALYYTLSYFKIGRIGEQIKKFGGGLNLTYLDSYYEVTLQSHKNMEAEINQNVVGSIPFIQLSLFDYLRDWLNNWQFNAGFEREIEYLIDQANEKERSRYQLEIEKDEIEYRQSVPPGVEYGHDYEVEIKAHYNFFAGRLVPAKLETRTFLFVTTKKPDLIDKTYIPEYTTLVKKLTDSFRRHSEKYATNFFAGKYSVNANLLVAPTSKELDAPTIQVSTTKLKKQKLQSNNSYTYLRF